MGGWMDAWDVRSILSSHLSISRTAKRAKLSSYRLIVPYLLASDHRVESCDVGLAAAQKDNRRGGFGAQLHCMTSCVVFPFFFCVDNTYISFFVLLYSVLLYSPPIISDVLCELPIRL